MIEVISLLAGIGVFCAVYRPTFYGFLISTQILSIAGAVMLMELRGDLALTHLWAFLMVLISGVVLVCGFAIGVRFYAQNGNTRMSAIRELKN